MKIACPLLRVVFAGLAASAFTVGWPADARAQQVPLVNKGAPGEVANRPRVSREYLIKAAIIYNLAKFTTWPTTAFADADAPVRLCVIGHDPFAAALESIDAKPIGDRRLNAVLIEDLEYASACHILFISPSEKDRLAEILNAVANQPLLTVADMQDFALSGGIVGLTELDGRSRLRVNVAAADKAGLRLSSKLLRLAEVVNPALVQPSVGPQK